MADVATHQARRELIRHILRTHVVSTQEDLGKLLEREGIEVGQVQHHDDVGGVLGDEKVLQQEGAVTQAEAGQQLGLSEPAARKRFQRALKRLREHAEEKS